MDAYDQIMAQRVCKCPELHCNCDGICTTCAKFVGDERYKQFWDGEEELAREVGGGLTC